MPGTVPRTAAVRGLLVAGPAPWSATTVHPFGQLATAFALVGSHFVERAAFRLLEGLGNVAIDRVRDAAVLAADPGATVVHEWLVAGRPQRLVRVTAHDGSTAYLLGTGRLVALYATPAVVARAWVVRGARVRAAFARDGARVLARRRRSGG